MRFLCQHRAVTRAAALAGAVSLIAGCESKPKDTHIAASSAAYSACMVTDTGGIDDRSFNASSWQGMKAAEKGGVKASFVQSASENDYVPNINSLITRKCNLIVTVGSLMGKATEQAAMQHPAARFAIVDSPATTANVYGMEFNTAQGAFLGGYLAAGMTKTGKVATFGGQAISQIALYMDGFWEGVQYYDRVHGKRVQVLGWDEHAPKGGSIAGSFIDQGAGERIANNFIQQGADIIFPVAGGTGLGAAAAAKQSHGKVSVIWVDTDGCVSAPQYCDVFLTTVIKGIAGAVQRTVTSAASGHFPTGSSMGTLADDGTGLAPYHDFSNRVPDALQSELSRLRRDIISGKIKITSPNQPKP